MNTQKQLILASASPRRKELLEMLGYTFSVQVAATDETVSATLPPDQVVRELARRKATAVANGCPSDAAVLGADTVVVLEGRVLGKPRDEAQAADMLRALSGRTHSVFTGWWIWDAAGCDGKRQGIGGAEHTAVHFAPLDDNVIREYVRACHPLDKAGAYGIQERIAAYIPRIEGCYYNVMGLPAAAVAEALRSLGIC